MSKGVGTLAVLIALAVTIALPSGVSQAAATHTNVVIEWNQTMLATFAAANVAPPPANRAGAIVQSAVFDAVNGIGRRYTAIHVQPAAPARDVDGVEELRRLVDDGDMAGLLTDRADAADDVDFKRVVSALASHRVPGSGRVKPQRPVRIVDYK